jgi:hypothetical protein
MTDDERQQIANDVRTTVEPLLQVSQFEGPPGFAGYNCCGCGTYRAILEHCIAVIVHGAGTPLPEEFQ